MKNKIRKIIIMMFIFLINIIPCKILAISDSDVNYYKLSNDYLIEEMITTDEYHVDHTVSLQQVLQNFTIDTYDTHIFIPSDENMTKFVLRTNHLNNFNGSLFNDMFSTYTGYNKTDLYGSSMSKIIGLTQKDESKIRISGMMFEANGNTVYIKYYNNTQNWDGMYLRIYDNNIVFTSEKNNATSWSITPKNDKRCFKFYSGNKYLTITDSGFGIVDKNDSSYIRLNTYYVGKQNGYVRYNDGDDYYLSDSSTTIELDGISYWAYKNKFSSFTSYERRTYDKNNTDIDTDNTYIIPGEKHNLTVDKFSVKDIYSVRTHKLYYKIVDENDNLINSDYTTYYSSPVLIKDKQTSVYKNLGSAMDVIEGCYITFDFALSGVNGGYDYKIQSGIFYDNDSYTNIDTIYYPNGIIDNLLVDIRENQTVLYTDVISHDSYLKIVVKKDVAALYQTQYDLYVGSPEYFQPTQKSYEGKSGNKVNLLAEKYKYEIVSFENPDLNNYEYQFTWKYKIDNEETTITTTTNALIEFTLPEVIETKELKVYCTVKKTNTVSKNYIEYNTEELTIKVNPIIKFDINIYDLYNKKCDSDKILVQASSQTKNIYSYIKDAYVKYNDEEYTKLNGVTSFTVDNSFLLFKLVSLDDSYVGYTYTIKNNGKYTFKLVNNYDEETTKELNYTNIKELVSIYVESIPKDTYYIDEEFNRNGLVIKAKYDDDTEIDISNQVTLNEIDFSLEGEKTIIVSYMNKTTTFTVNVIKNNPIVEDDEDEENKSEEEINSKEEDNKSTDENETEEENISEEENKSIDKKETEEENISEEDNKSTDAKEIEENDSKIEVTSNETKSTNENETIKESESSNNTDKEINSEDISNEINDIEANLDSILKEKNNSSNQNTTLIISIIIIIIILIIFLIVKKRKK